MLNLAILKNELNKHKNCAEKIVEFNFDTRGFNQYTVA